MQRTKFKPIKMNHPERIQVLLSVYKESKQDLRTIRDRVLRLVSTSIALFLLLAGWVIQTTIVLELIQVVTLILVVIVFWIGNLFILRDIKRTFKSSHLALVRVEQCLRLHMSDFFHPDRDPLLPLKFNRLAKGKHLLKFELIMTFAGLTAILIIAIDYLVQ